MTGHIFVKNKKISRPESLEIPNKSVVGTARFELATSSTPRKRATKLRHVPLTF